ncbi:hypothetical protein F5X96DRAFT_450565 [Biscogniauxia mediterranea]|nr:hypothetical protein F5X96DRAFT_450565 [Biscogniauxia mediterranea]
MAKTRPIPYRPRPKIQPARQPAALVARWKPRGPFRFLDLPPELRTHILELAILDWTSHRDVVSLFLTCRALYAEAASVFYHEVLLDDSTSARLLKRTRSAAAPAANPFLAGALSPLSPRLHVRALTVRFCADDQIRAFADLYAGALRDMAARGSLRSLRLEVGSKFPADDFWGGTATASDDDDDDNDDGGDLSCDNVRLLGGGGAQRDVDEVWAPAFVATPAFQAFLGFLQDSGIPRVTLYVDAGEHNKLWCPFHRVHSSGAPCEGEWPGKVMLLKVDRKKLVRTLMGVQIAEPQ